MCDYVSLWKVLQHEVGVDLPVRVVTWSLQRVAIVRCASPPPSRSPWSTHRQYRVVCTYKWRLTKNGTLRKNSLQTRRAEDAGSTRIRNWATGSRQRISFRIWDSGSWCILLRSAFQLRVSQPPFPPVRIIILCLFSAFPRFKSSS